MSGASNKSKVGLIAGLIAGLMLALLLVGVLFFLCKYRYKGNKGEVFVDVPGNCHDHHLIVKLGYTNISCEG